MGFVLVVAGLLMIVTGAKGTYAQFGRQVAADFTGPGNFTYWIASIGVVGALGYVESFRAFSRAFMALILIGMLLSNRGFFAKLSEALAKGPTAPIMPAGQANDKGPALPDIVGGNTNQQGQPTLGGKTFPQMLQDIIPNFLK